MKLETKNVVEITPREALYADQNIVDERGDKICQECKKFIKDHPLVTNKRNKEGRLYLRRLCNGKFIKV